MSFASLTLLAVLWVAALGACWSKPHGAARVWLCLLGVLTGVGIVMLSGRTVGLLWIVFGASGLLMSILPDGSARRLLYLRPASRLLWTAPLVLFWLLILRWEPPVGIPLAPKAIELVQVVAIAFAHHTWAVVGIALLGVLTLFAPVPEGDR